LTLYVALFDFENPRIMDIGRMIGDIFRTSVCPNIGPWFYGKWVHPIEEECDQYASSVYPTYCGWNRLSLSLKRTNLHLLLQHLLLNNQLLKFESGGVQNKLVRVHLGIIGGVEHGEVVAERKYSVAQ
jgi:hypothetical protein